MSQKPLLSGPYLDKLGRELADTATQSQFLAVLKELNDAPESQRSSKAIEVARLDFLKQRGVELSDIFRITTRTFEDPSLANVARSVVSSDSPIVKFDGESGYVAFAGRVVQVSKGGSPTVPPTDDTLPPLPVEVADAIKAAAEEISAFVLTSPFQAILDELYAIESKDRRHEFVLDVLLRPEGLLDRGVQVPEKITIQRSQFGDARPTLFCIAKYLPFDDPWKKVTITFDSIS
ncbi:hypothetical protein [Arthrobacter sp. 162MFSha1.1]|uniref:hypothetical protein n=1 Tax=Arthrobacter sp. 162MFSha1.1 TaxID=1151119 RepID=UPI0003682E0B|nr:hypothetical protein [Arthrobacter sp. 162MFSha1.1]